MQIYFLHTLGNEKEQPCQTPTSLTDDLKTKMRKRRTLKLSKLLHLCECYGKLGRSKHDQHFTTLNAIRCKVWFPDVYMNISLKSLIRRTKKPM
ncbi:CLUMA_CG017080, isoform A [Clunio marinus]|uniref:CLUMA_CG017080, isoform A n=1 Tax=Clunio marinus TaxID=568069 RepID=A0A1J1IUU9_9DIPT|nr:CLUMA_CG017080, isoform A [Clunio marinus]